MINSAAMFLHAARLVVPAALCAALLAACTSPPVREPVRPGVPVSPGTPAAPPAAVGKPGYYKDDGPADVTPADLDAIPDAVPRREALHRFANRPYVVFGREYVPATSLRPYRERGVASWYGRKFHGQKTSNGETYDMFAMTAAHPTLPLPSYVRVTSTGTGRSVVVRVNDRGPFLHDRVIDLSYAAAHRLGIAQRGSGEVEVEALLFDDPVALAAPALPPVGPAASATAVAARAAGPTPVVPVVPVAPAVAPGLAATASGAGPASAPAATGPAPLQAIGAPPSSGAPPAARPATAGSEGSAAGPAVAAPAGRVETTPVAPGPSGFVVQLGAFGSYPNAQAFAGHLANQLTPIGVEAQIRQVNGLFRVLVGPFAGRDDARRMAERIRSEFGLPTTIAVH